MVKPQFKMYIHTTQHDKKGMLQNKTYVGAGHTRQCQYQCTIYLPISKLEPYSLSNRRG